MADDPNQNFIDWITRVATEHPHLSRPLEELGRQGLSAIHRYASGPIANPALQVAAGGGTPGQMEAGMAQAYMPSLNRTFDFLARLGSTAAPSGNPYDTGPIPQLPPTKAVGEGFKWNFDLDARDLKSATSSMHNAGTQMATGIYDRFLFPGVIKQMQDSPDFAPFINELLGTNKGEPA